MLHPEISRIKFDKQVFRMLVVNAVLRSLNNYENSWLERNPTDPKKDRRSESTQVREILIQVGFTYGQEQECPLDTKIERDIMYHFLNCRLSRSQFTNHVGDPNLSCMTIAVADTGTTGKNKYIGRSLEQDKICEKLVTNGFGGFYEMLEIDGSGIFRNLTRFSIPYCAAPSSLRSEDSSKPKLWLDPLCDKHNGFKRPMYRYEHIKRRYIKLRSPAPVDDDNNDAADLLHRRAILVHPEIDAGNLHAGAFEVEGWLCTVCTSYSDALAHPDLPGSDLVLVCSSVLSAEHRQELIFEEEFNCRGFYGALVCLQDAGALSESAASVGDYHYIEPPVLQSTVLFLSELSDRRLLEYIIGANKVL